MNSLLINYETKKELISKNETKSFSKGKFSTKLKHKKNEIYIYNDF